MNHLGATTGPALSWISPGPGQAKNVFSRMTDGNIEGLKAGIAAWVELLTCH